MKNWTVLILFLGMFRMAYAERGLTLKERVVEDYKNFYTLKEGVLYVSSLGLGGVLAHSPVDQEVSDFYQREVRSPLSNSISSLVKPFGNRSTMLAFLGSFFVLEASKKITGTHFFLTFTERVSRMLFVGVPPLLMTQWALGGSRPSAESPHSYWKPFQNNNSVSASGHSFFGALPFLALASMTESFPLRILLYGASTFTAFSRLNDKKHYLSQILIGWTLAFMSYEALSRSNSRLRVSFELGPRELALGVSYRFQ